MKWENDRRHGEIIGANAKVGCFRLSVHHYIYCGDIWFTSCFGIFETYELGEMSLNQAQVMATAKLQLELEAAIKVITG